MHVSLIAERDETRIVASVEDHPMTAWIKLRSGANEVAIHFPRAEIDAWRRAAEIINAAGAKAATAPALAAE